jgi:hypothetical protein
MSGGIVECSQTWFSLLLNTVINYSWSRWLENSPVNNVLSLSGAVWIPSHNGCWQSSPKLDLKALLGQGWPCWKPQRAGTMSVLFWWLPPFFRGQGAMTLVKAVKWGESHGPTLRPMILLWKKYFDGLFWLTEQIPSPFPSFFFFFFSQENVHCRQWYKGCKTNRKINQK